MNIIFLFFVRNSPSMHQPKPVTLISGFLGSGKTTLINRILEQRTGYRFAVIVNEFGQIGLDEALLKGDAEFVEMENGCLCCSLNEDLLTILQKLKNRGDFDAVLLETTGIADPLSVAWTFLRPQLDQFYRLSALITVVDALNFETMLGQAMETKLQVERADIIYFSKISLISPEQADRTEEKVKELNPRARFVFSHEPAWRELLLETHDEEYKLKKLSEKTIHRADDFEAVSFTLDDKPVSLEQMEDFFSELPPSIFRAKAVFMDRKTLKAYSVHSVCGRVELAPLSFVQAPAAAVFIGKKINKKELQARWLELFKG